MVLLRVPTVLAKAPGPSRPGRGRVLFRRMKERLLALDVFRGATVAGMLLVNNPGTWSAGYPPLRHAPWHGWTPTDLIFPFFLFIVGVTTHLSLSRRRTDGAAERAIVRKILTRGATIVLVGLLLHALAFIGTDRWAHLRIPGVLQRIGVVYTLAALLTLRTSVKAQVVIIAALLFGYWFAMTLLPVPGGGLGALVLDDAPRTLAAWLDRTVLGEQHLWSASRTWDPEGILSTVPAVGTAMLGVLTGRWIRSDRPLEGRIAGLFAAGCAGMVLGLMWHWSFPINKSLWTSSYVLFTGGMAAAAIAFCIWLIDLHGSTWWTPPFAAYGVNPLLAFVGSGAMAHLLGMIHVGSGEAAVPLQRAIYESAFAPWLEPRNASLAYAICFVLVWLGILWPLWKKQIVWKV